ncbi:Rav1p [Sporobolomyces koalae]|uniref:Rav1p n=1 Tax=Sporobolomyces koalae TaxID=500713 RepID=UPI00317BEC07
MIHRLVSHLHDISTAVALDACMNRLRLDQHVVPAPDLIVSTTIRSRPYLITVSNDTFQMLDVESNAVHSTVSFNEAFPHLHIQERISSISINETRNHVVVTLGNKVAVFEPTFHPDDRIKQWIVHSSWTFARSPTCFSRSIDYAQGRIIICTNSNDVMVYTLDETDQEQALPHWTLALSVPFKFTIEQVKLSPCGRIVALLPRENSIALIYDLVERANLFQLEYRSRAVHTCRLMSIAWRQPSSHPTSDSGPVLVTTTIEHRVHLWGCVIDEPNDFSLWISLPSIPTPLPRARETDKKRSFSGSNTRSPLAIIDSNQPDPSSARKKACRSIVWTQFWKTRDHETEHVANPELGKQDLFWSLTRDGMFHLTIVSNLDRRPPTCLTARTISFPQVSTVIPREHLSHFERVSIVSLFDENSPTTTKINLVCQSPRRLSLVRYQLELRSSLFANIPTTLQVERLSDPPLNHVGTIRRFVRTVLSPRDELAVMGIPDRIDSPNRERLQIWNSSPTSNQTLSYREPGILDLATRGDQAKIARWSSTLTGSTFMVVGQGSMLSVYEQRGQEAAEGIERITKYECGKQVEFDRTRVFEAFPDPEQVWIVAVNESNHTSSSLDEEPKQGRYTVDTWIYHVRSRSIFPGAPTLQIPTLETGQLDRVSIVPRMKTSTLIEVTSVDTGGTVQNWTLNPKRIDPTWSNGSPKQSLRTGRERVKKMALKGNGIIALATDNELSIWNQRNLGFGNALEFSLSLTEPAVALEFSIDGHLLALATRTRVSIFSSRNRQLTMSDPSSSSRWYQLAVIEPTAPLPISNFAFYRSGLAIACRDQIVFHALELQKGKQIANKRQVITRSVKEQYDRDNAELWITDYAFLVKTVELGHFDLVRKLLVRLSHQLDDDGKVVSTSSMDAEVKSFGVDEYLSELSHSRRAGSDRNKHNLVEVFSNRSERTGQEYRLEDGQRKRLVAAMSFDTLRGVSRESHVRIGQLVDSVAQVQSKLTSTDENGIRYMFGLRQFIRSNPSFSPTSDPASDRLESKHVLFAYHSRFQKVLLDDCVQAISEQGGKKLCWETAKKVGIPLWLNDRELLAQTVETIGRTSFLLDPNNRDPILPMLFFLALRKPHTVYTLWKQSTGHSDQRQMLKFLANDFELERWKSAARKNAFALLSKRRFLFAAAFFLLGDSLSDCVAVILRHLTDPVLAFTIARVYAPDTDDSLLRDTVKRTILPQALHAGDRFLSSWALDILGSKELSVRVLVESLPALFEPDSTSPANGAPGFEMEPGQVSNPAIEDPTRIAFLQQLLQAMPSSCNSFVNESEFVLLVARQLVESGCHLLALDLVRSYRFVPHQSSRPKLESRNATTTMQELETSVPQEAGQVIKKEPTDFVEPPASSLFDMLGGPPLPTPIKKSQVSTVQVVEPEQDTKNVELEEEEQEEERRKRVFREASGMQPKIESKNVQVEAFSFDAFGF